MKLSVIIVNYNVRSYLEQCLRSVEEALRGLDGDIYVVDNLSTDGSVEMVQALFPAVKLMANRENVVSAGPTTRPYGQVMRSTWCC